MSQTKTKIYKLKKSLIYNFYIIRLFISKILEDYEK
jgi:hypothetical protein